LKLLKGHCSYKMASTLSFVVIFALTRDYCVVCVGQFFEITKDDKTMKAGKPFLTSDIFECSGKDTCKTYTRSASSNGNADPRNVVFSMRKSKDPSAKYTSCAAAIQLNDNNEAYYNIKRGNMLHPIEAECKMINGKSYAIIHHDSEKTELVTGYEAPGSFRREVKYVTGLEDTKLFVDSSQSCSQLTRFDCYHSIINENEKFIHTLWTETT